MQLYKTQHCNVKTGLLAKSIVQSGVFIMSENTLKCFIKCMCILQTYVYVFWIN